MAVKAAYIIIFCCLLIHMNAFTTDFAFYRVVNKLGALSMLIPQSITYLLYPFLGWLADVYFTRYKFVFASFLTIIIGSTLALASGLVYLNFPHSQGMDTADK